MEAATRQLRPSRCRTVQSSPWGETVSASSAFLMFAAVACSSTSRSHVRACNSALSTSLVASDQDLSAPARAGAQTPTLNPEEGTGAIVLGYLP